MKSVKNELENSHNGFVIFSACGDPSRDFIGYKVRSKIWRLSLEEIHQTVHVFLLLKIFQKITNEISKN